MRVGERDDLPGVGRIGEDLLVARERGVEDDLTRRHTVVRPVPDRNPLERLAVGQHQQRLRHPITSSVYQLLARSWHNAAAA